MHLYSIMRLNEDHVDEICADIVQQYKNGVADCALFSMTLTPEGTPPINKAEQLCAKYDLFRDKLESMGIECGILVQATIGHGYALNNPAPFTTIRNMTDGKITTVTCPSDLNFREYIKESMRVIASHRPKCIMIDDDFRLINWREGRGCLCDNHLKAFEEKAGVKKTREEIKNHVYGNTAEDEKFRNIFIETQIESLIECAKSMREGIDSVDPTIPGMFCCVGNACEGAAQIAKVLAGENNPVVVRINNGNYTPAGARFLSAAFMRAAIQIPILKSQGKIDVILAETDTCPQNRYSTGAMSLHSHFTGTILEGAQGAKHWITRAIYEPDSGKAYRKLLAKYSGFYKVLSETVPNLKWRGCRMPLSVVPDYAFETTTFGASTSVNAWTTHILERLGIPVFFSEEASKISFLEGLGDTRFTDNEITDMLKNTLVLDGQAAENLCNRGFKELMGVDVKKWNGSNISGEILPSENNLCSKPIEAREIIPLDDSVIKDSYCYHLRDDITKEILFPACTVYKNKLGGTAIVFCGKAKTNFHYTSAFSFLNETRKKQLIRLISKYGDLPLYYTEDEEVYMKVADCSDDSLFCALFNIGFDPIEKIALHSEKTPESVYRLEPDGSKKELDFEYENGIINIDSPAYTLSPVILFIK